MVSPEIKRDMRDMRDAELPKMKPAEWENTDTNTNRYEMYIS